MKYIITGFLIALVATIALALRNDTRVVDAETKRLCMEYALRDHEKEFAPSRWEYLKSMGNPNDVEFWYTSCLNHTKYPVGGAENEWLK